MGFSEIAKGLYINYIIRKRATRFLQWATSTSSIGAAARDQRVSLKLPPRKERNNSHLNIILILTERPSCFIYYALGTFDASLV